jgi:hypothetical protein
MPFDFMKYMWVVVAVIVVLVMLPFIKMLFGLGKGQARRRQLLQTGIPAKARILGIQPTGTSIETGGHRQPQVAMMLEVQPPSGPAYQAQLVTFISEFQIPQIQPGAMVQVRYDRNNPRELALEALGLAPAGAAPGQASFAMPVAAQQFRLPMGAIIGIVIGLIGAAVGIYVAAVNTGGVGLESRDVGGVCGQTYECCKKVAEQTKNATALETCANFKKIGVPDEACKASLDAFKLQAKTLNLTCE